ncbi:MAG TPA: thioredoxin domain-containing protein [Bryobacteraceae bacterium]|nr:thioredoxin domain-containing protein [Bryobacteraceae bacterium]
MHTNRLAEEKSPYLLQHAHNPVDWYPWGPEAFEKARLDNKPIFLSVGYSTCHWCHVMERESFESERIAEILNRSFVPVKVDREERPDIDRIYMTFVQATTGGGGWPMSVWLTPDLRPFFGGTYFPPDNRYGRTGFATVLERIAEAWRQDREKIVASSIDVVEQLTRHVDPASEGRPAQPLDRASIEGGFHALRRSYDTRYGGFGGAPKFPRPAAFHFLLRYWSRTGNREALDMVLETLRIMAAAGMNDQLGGGFHRYAVDERWFVPHFEKMLYDQAQLATSYIEAFQITGDFEFAATARETLDYVLRDMRHNTGAFYSAEDADSAIDPAHPDEKGEGAFYIWSRAEIEEIAGALVADWFCYRYGVEKDGNVADDPHQEFTGRNILYRAHTVEQTAEHFGRSLDEVRTGILQASRKLLEARNRRPRPHLDDKILTAWNGLMISAFARAGAALSEKSYTDAALRAAGFILERLYDPQTGVLLRRFRDGHAAIPGFLDDYAFLAQACLDIYEAVFDLPWLDRAVALTGKMRELFEDSTAGGFYSTQAGDPSLVMRIKEDYDGAEPSGNSVAILNLLRLSAMTGRPELRESAERALAAFSGRLTAAPVAVPQMLAAYGFSLAPPREIVIVGEKSSPDTLELLKILHSRYLPHAIALLVDSEETRAALGSGLPAIEGMRKLDGRASAWVCENFACRLPVSSPAEFAELLQ